MAKDIRPSSYSTDVASQGLEDAFNSIVDTLQTRHPKSGSNMPFELHAYRYDTDSTFANVKMSIKTVIQTYGVIACAVLVFFESTKRDPSTTPNRKPGTCA